VTAFDQLDIQREDPMAASAALTAALIDVAETLTRKAAGTDSAAEAKDFAQGVLSLVQSVVVLDPSMSQGGTPLEHDIAMQHVRNQGAVQVEIQRGENAIKQARAVAAAPQPSQKRTVSVRRDGHGRASEYSVEG
jgi:hypothetical protein